MITQKSKIMELLLEEPMSIHQLALATHLPDRKVAGILEQLSEDNNDIQFSGGKFKLMGQNKGQPIEESITEISVVESVRRRDYGKYSINGGEEVGKARLVLEIIRNVINDNPDGMSLKKLKEMFPDSLHKKFGVIQLLPEAIKRSEKHKRFFVDSPLKAGRQAIAVCREWSVDNIKPVIETAKSMGYDIQSS